MNSLSDYLINHALKTVVIIIDRSTQRQSASDFILQQYVDKGGGVFSPRLGQYKLDHDNRLYFFTKFEILEAIRGMHIDLLLFSDEIDSYDKEVLLDCGIAVKVSGNIGTLLMEHYVWTKDRALPF